MLNTDPQFIEAANKYGTRTYKGAEARITRAIGGMQNPPLTMVLSHGDRFMPVAIVCDRTSWMIRALVDLNIYTTNAV